MKDIPVYKYPGEYARENGELELYRASNRANIACKEAIEAAISEHYYDNRLHKEAVSQVVEQFGFERTLYVMANTIRHKDWDMRFSADNKQWAQTIPVFENPDAWGSDRNIYFVVDKHSGLADLFTQIARHEYLLTQPLSKNEIRYEAAKLLDRLQSEREPNSPSGTHFMAQISPDFLQRASSKDTQKLLGHLPFPSAALSTLNDRKGVFLFVSKEENRSLPLRERKPSVREKLQKPTEPKTAQDAPKKNKEQVL